MASNFTGYGLTNKSYIRIFKDEATLREMLNLYLAGWSSVSLGKKYKCDHTSILHQIRRAGLTNVHRIRVIKQEKVKQEAIYYPVQKTESKGKYDYIFLEEVNPGKTYKEYLAEKAQRQRDLTRVRVQNFRQKQKDVISTKTESVELQSVEIHQVRL